MDGPSGSEIESEREKERGGGGRGGEQPAPNLVDRQSSPEALYDPHDLISPLLLTRCPQASSSRSCTAERDIFIAVKKV